jgi:predicted nucleotidyltransferase
MSNASGRILWVPIVRAVYQNRMSASRTAGAFLTLQHTHRHNEPMSRAEVLTTLRVHEREIRASGVTRLSVFGSTARDQQGPASDVDLLAAFDPNRRLSLLDIIRIQNQIGKLLGTPVDLIEEGTLKPRIQASIAREIIRAF